MGQLAAASGWREITVATKKTIEIMAIIDVQPKCFTERNSERGMMITTMKTPSVNFLSKYHISAGSPVRNSSRSISLVPF